MRSRYRRFLILALAAGVVIGGTATWVDRLAAAEPPVPPDADASPLSCEDGATRSAAVGVVVNNAWNRAAAGKGPWRQCLQSRVRDGGVDYGWYWHWPSRDGIYAYPEMLVGRSPWTAAPSNDPRFPRSVGSLRSMRIDYDVESHHKGKKNLAVEFWLTDPAASTRGATSSSIRAELMIWTDESPGLADTSGPAAEIVAIDGREWSVQAKPGWGDMSGASTQKWLFVTYRALQHSTTGHYDARRILQHAVDRGWVDARWQIEGVEFGNEIVSGSGSTWIKRFDVTID